MMSSASNFNMPMTSSLQSLNMPKLKSKMDSNISMESATRKRQKKSVHEEEDAEMEEEKTQEKKLRKEEIKKPSLESILEEFSTSGSFGVKGKQLLIGLVSDKQALTTLLKGLQPADQEVVLTWVAVQVLTVVFGAKKGEWDMICKKAKKWLKS